LYNLDKGALRHRFLRQDGYAITIRQRNDMQEILNFDLKKTNCLIDSVKFRIPVGYRPSITDLMDETGDPLPRHLQSVMRNLVEEFFEGKICEHLSLLIDKMYVGANPSIKVFKEIKEQLFKYGNQFTIDFLNDAITIIKSEGAAHEEITLLKKQLDQIKVIKYWDEPVFASGEWILDKIQVFSTKKDEVMGQLAVAFNNHFEKAKLRHFID